MRVIPIYRPNPNQIAKLRRPTPNLYCFRIPLDNPPSLELGSNCRSLLTLSLNNIVRNQALGVVLNILESVPEGLLAYP